MANVGYIETLLNALPDTVKKHVTAAFRHALNGGLSLGGIEDGERGANFRWYRFDAVTSTAANGEFSIHHGQGSAPILCWQILPLNTVNAQLVRLTNTRAADAQRIYLKSPEVGASFSVLVEF